jgi:hypothetical protein
MRSLHKIGEIVVELLFESMYFPKRYYLKNIFFS